MSALPARLRLASVLVAAAALGLAVVASSPAHASRLPADPLPTVVAAGPTTHLVADAHAASVRVAIADLHGFTTGLSTS